MVSPAILRNATDAYVTSKRPKLNRSSTEKLYMMAVGGDNTRYAYIYFSLPFPMGATIIDAHLRVRNAGAYSGAVTMTSKRINEKWSISKINWDNRPFTAGSGPSVTKSNAAADSVWDFDVTSDLQTVSTSGVWWGFRIEVDSAAGKAIWSAQAQNANRPELEIAWSDAPAAPEDLSPGGGRAIAVVKPVLLFDFVDDAGNTELNAAQIQYDDASTFTSPTWDSGTLFTSEPQIDTSTVAGAPSLTGTLTWWRVRVQDGAGLWSAWSDPESMRYVAGAGLVINSPPAGGVVNDSTPPVLWTLTGGTQSAYKVLVSKTATPEKILWNSGKITSPDVGITIPPKIIKKEGLSYRVTLLVWDTTDREKNNQATIYARVFNDFTFQAGATSPVTNVVADQAEPWPWVDITFNRATAADEYNIYRDGEIIDHNVDAAELFVSGTSYKYRDRMAFPRVPHTWSVQAVVNKVTSGKVDSNSLTTRLIAPMMMELDGTSPVYFMNPALDPSQATFQEMHQPVNAPPVLVTQYLGGYQGHVEGIFVDDILPGVTAREMRDRFKQWKEEPGVSYYFYMVDEVLKIVPYNMTYKPEAKSGGIVRYRVSFDFFESED